MVTTDQRLAAIRTLADRHGLPDGLGYLDGFPYPFELFHRGSDARMHRLTFSERSPTFVTWLAAALAHWETEAEDKLGLHVHESDIQPGDHRGDMWCLGPDGVTTNSRYYTLGDHLSRLSARTLALVDGVRAVAAEGEKPCHEPTQKARRNRD